MALQKWQYSLENAQKKIKDSKTENEEQTAISSLIQHAGDKAAYFKKWYPNLNTARFINDDTAISDNVIHYIETAHQAEDKTKHYTYEKVQNPQNTTRLLENQKVIQVTP